MTEQFGDIAGEAIADGKISSEDIRELQQTSWEDGRVSQVEAETLFLVHDQMRGTSEEWSAYFIEAMTQYVVNGGEKPGEVGERRAKWLVGQITTQGQIAGMEELELVVQILEHASSVPGLLRDLAIRTIEQAACEGTGPTREGLDGEPGHVTAEETNLLRRMVLARGSEKQSVVSQAEADALFRIKDATLGGANAADWPDVFVRGVGSFLQGFDGNDPLEAAHVHELDAFMNTTGAKIRDFLNRTLHAGEAEVGEGTRDQAWMQAQIEADEKLDPLEKALLVFIGQDQAAG